MAERQLPSNSHAMKERAAEEVTKRQAVTQGHARKKSAIVSNIISEDANEVKNYVLSDVVFPAIKDIIYNAFTSTIEMFLFGEARGRRVGGGYSRGRGGYSDYSRMYRRYEDERPRGERTRASRSMGVVEAVVKTRADAVYVRDEMLHDVDDYEQVRVSEFYQLVGMDTDYMDEKWGWTDLRDNDILIRPYRGEFLISMPRPIAL